MTSCSPSKLIERARPLLGTTVSIHVEHEDADAAHEAVSAAFVAVERIHALMSFHEAESDLSRLHAATPGERVRVNAQTVEVLREACRLSVLSEGVFDVTVGSRLVAKGLLPAPAGSSLPSIDANWKDIEIDGEDVVVLRRAVWIDLGGIAKGYAVDRAIDVLRAHGILNGCVNAGGDLRTLGDGPHRIAVATDEACPTHVPVLDVGEASVATSSGRARSAEPRPHVDGRQHQDVGIDEVATVVADHCIHADALTKVVLAMGVRSASILQRYGAVAYLQNAAGHWASIGTSL